MKTANGVITLVQEQRFQLKGDDGRHRLFILTHDAAQEWSDLKQLEKANCPVTVFYTGEGKLSAAAAHEVQQQ
jgi:hypothetical protein